MPEHARLIRAIGSKKTMRAAVITTYNASFPFFEHVVLRRLQSAGCRHIVVFMDARQLRQAVATDDRRPRLAGVEYTLIPVRYPGTFHPKVLLQVGESYGRVWVGSHNLTLAGFNHNAEATTYAAMRQDADAKQLVLQAWQAIRAWGAETSDAAEALEQVEHVAPWLAEPPSASRDQVLASNRSQPLWPQIEPHLPPHIERILLTGPLFDQKLAFVQTLVQRAPSAELVIGLDPKDVVFPAAAADDLPATVRLVHARPAVPPHHESSYVHAKAMLIEGRQESILVSGSANPSAPAFLDHRSGNADAITLRRLKRGADPLNLHALLTASALTADDLQQISNLERPEQGASGPPVWTVSLTGHQLALPSDLPTFDTAHFIGESGTAFDANSTAIQPTDVQQWPRVRWVQLTQDGDVVAMLMVHHRRRLARLARTREDLRLTDALRSLETRIPDLASVLALLDPILDQPTQRRARQVQRTQKTTSAGIDSGGADAPPSLEDLEELYGTDGDLAEVMLYVHHRLGAQVDPLQVSEEEVISSEADNLVAPVRWVPPIDVREQVRHRFHRIHTKLATVLHKPRFEAESQAHARMAKLSATLGLANATIRRTPPEPRQTHDHLRLVSTQDLGALLYDGVAAAYFNHDLRSAAKTLGRFAEEVRSIPPLLAWLCYELGMRPPKPAPRYASHLKDDDLTDRAVWVTLFPSLDKDHWNRLTETVLATSASDDALGWLRSTRRWTRHIRRIRNEPTDHLERRQKPMPGDLVMKGSGKHAVLRVVREEVGGPKQTRRVSWPLPGDPYNSALFDNAVLLRPVVWKHVATSR